MDSSGFIIGDPVKSKPEGRLGMIIGIQQFQDSEYVLVRPAGLNHTTVMYGPNDLEICICAKRIK
jgi:hypothetical protein